MDILEKQMAHRGLKQSYRTVQPDEDVVVECWSCFSIRECRVHVFPPGSRDVYDGGKECFCSCLFAAGKVVGITVQDPVHGYGDIDVRYDVEVCNNRSTYILFKYCRPSDFAEYQPGDWVIVYYNSFVADECCPVTGDYLAMPACGAVPLEDGTAVFAILPLTAVGLRPFFRSEWIVDEMKRQWLGKRIK